MARDEGSTRAPSLAAYHQRRPSAVLECEARRVARTIGSYGALHERQLFELCNAGCWTRGTFARACDLAVELGWVRRLGAGFYARPRRDGQAPALDGAAPVQRAFHPMRRTRRS